MDRWDSFNIYVYFIWRPECHGARFPTPNSVTFILTFSHLYRIYIFFLMAQPQSHVLCQGPLNFWVQNQVSGFVVCCFGILLYLFVLYSGTNSQLLL